MSKTWFITGCSSGFGLEIAKLLLEKGDSVVATARKPEVIEIEHENILKLKLDVTDKEQIAAAVAEAVKWKGKIDVLVNNAGFGNISSVEETSDELWRKLFNVNVFGLVDVTKAVLPHMKKEKSGHIFNFSSIAGLLAMPGFGPYCATKFAVEGLSEGLAQEVGPLGIKVTVIEPGAFRTKFVGNVEAGEIGEEYQATVGETAKMLQGFEGTAPGDPRKAAEVLYQLFEMEQPPLRILLGKDAYGWGLPKLEGMVAEIKKYESLTTSTDFEE